LFRGRRIVQHRVKECEGEIFKFDLVGEGDEFEKVAAKRDGVEGLDVGGRWG
jgi:hypothetical protein